MDVKIGLFSLSGTGTGCLEKLEMLQSGGQIGQPDLADCNSAQGRGFVTDHHSNSSHSTILITIWFLFQLNSTLKLLLMIAFPSNLKVICTNPKIILWTLCIQFTFIDSKPKFTYYYKKQSIYCLWGRTEDVSALYRQRRTQRNGMELRQGRVSLGIRKKFFIREWLSPGTGPGSQPQASGA